jgi:glucitol operon activator protein
VTTPFVRLMLALAIAWLLQGVLSFWQAQRFYSRIQKLRKLGRSAVGLSGNIYKTKAYAVLVADPQDRIVHAEKLTGFTIFAQLRPVDSLQGRKLQEVVSGPIEGLSPKLQSAFKMAAEAILKEAASQEPSSEKDPKDPSHVSLGQDVKASGKEVVPGQ